MGWKTDSNLSNKNVPWLPMSAGRFYSSPNINVLTTVAFATGTLYAIPVLLTEQFNPTSINIEVTTQSAGNTARMGIYKDLNGSPSTLLVDAGTVSLTGTGNKSLTITFLYPANWYWLVVVANGAATVRALSQTSALTMLGASSATDTTIHVGFSVVSMTSINGLPTIFPGGGSLMAGAAPRLLISA